VTQFRAPSTKILNGTARVVASGVGRRQDPIARTIITTAETTAVIVAQHP
jgi:hypothetical protein